MERIGLLNNFDLFLVGIAIAAIGFLGLVVFLNNRKSITNRAFLFFTVVSIFWDIYDYLIFQFSDPSKILWILRFHVFFAVWYCFGLFNLFFVFPSEKIFFKKIYKFFLIPVVSVVSLLTLTPLTFSRIGGISESGQVASVINGPGIVIFGVTAIGLIAGGIFIFIRKIFSTPKAERKAFILVLLGFSITFGLHIAFNFILPAFFDNAKFAPYGALFTFPLVALTAYSIIKHRFFNARIIATEALTFILALVTLFEMLLSIDFISLVFRIGVFLLVLSFGILLIRSVRKEVEQKEKLQKLTEELDEKNKKLTELDHLKSEFLNFATHQVKSPMAVIKGYAQLIYDGTSGEVSAEVKDKAMKIKQSADRTLALVGNMLDLGKIESGKMEFAFADVDIVKMAQSMAGEYKVIGSGKGLDVQFESAVSSMIIRADEQKIRQVLQNVIDNSIKYTDKGFVKIKFEEQGDYVVITVSDSGRGMSAEFQKKLFGRFIRDEKNQGQIGGTGLGLYIAKQIVDAHHGKIWAESDGEGKGSRFFIQLAKH